MAQRNILRLASEGGTGLGLAAHVKIDGPAAMAPDLEAYLLRQVVRPPLLLPPLDFRIDSDMSSASNVSVVAYGSMNIGPPPPPRFGDFNVDIGALRLHPGYRLPRRSPPQRPHDIPPPGRARFAPK